MPPTSAFKRKRSASAVRNVSGSSILHGPAQTTIPLSFSVSLGHPMLMASAASCFAPSYRLNHIANPFPRQFLRGRSRHQTSSQNPRQPSRPREPRLRPSPDDPQTDANSRTGGLPTTSMDDRINTLLSSVVSRLSEERPPKEPTPIFLSPTEASTIQ